MRCDSDIRLKKSHDLVTLCVFSHAFCVVIDSSRTICNAISVLSIQFIGLIKNVVIAILAKISMDDGLMLDDIAMETFALQLTFRYT